MNNPAVMDLCEAWDDLSTMGIEAINALCTNYTSSSESCFCVYCDETLTRMNQTGTWKQIS